ncbi:MAG: PDR/VanB family oxidoreductase [Parahaliea sp.]
MTLSLNIARVSQETDAIRSYELRETNGAVLPCFEAGAHISVRLDNGLVRQYSLANDPDADSDHYLIGVLNDRDSRGGSRWIFENWREGQAIRVDPPMNHFPLVETQGHRVLIAGGIGITPVLAMAHALNHKNADYTLYYCARSPQQAAFRSVLTSAPFAGHVKFIYDGGDPAKGLDLGDLLREQQTGEQVYVCGPSGLIAGVRAAAAHWPDDAVQFEYFEANAQSLAGSKEGSGAFTVEIASTGQRFSVPPDRTIISVLTENGIEVDKLCEEGLCGSCLTALREGVPDHRDSVQSTSERESNSYIALCCSRALSPTLVLDL